MFSPFIRPIILLLIATSEQNLQNEYKNVGNAKKLKTRKTAW